MLVSEAASVLGVSTRRVRQLVEEGRLKHEMLTARLCLLDPVEVRKLAKIERPVGRPKVKLPGKRRKKGASA